LELLKTLLFSFLVVDVPNDRLLIQTYGTHTVALGPKVQPREVPFLTEKFPMNVNRRFPFQKTHRVGYAELRWDTQTQMKVFRHRIPLHKVNLRLAAQLPYDPSDLLP
jgi:hypothetical protein